MGMPLELNTMIVTKGREKRLDENYFSLVKEGYRLYPLDIPVEVKRTIDGDLNGTGIIKKVEWENNQTVIMYQLVALNSTN
ncbi:DUF2584 domain-containing protein [Cytobacillus oceanisediminis]|jgi:hypothetical protein|uniref:Uncharacterized protein DUF2584 n=1 Tax=Cytobacillus oceanisediminis TaxID=665099 RepID=A0A2V2ZRE3_9BACI|nr:DUF2584 domain-containing protein [Cytobacillus oceanisediminis]PWW26219.1 uncharacterized protein DUF2584 [Cytobacillus oceanisediminis]TWH84512.1 uncharacterized protein DUF2584 [Cytobacillus oceanisediminis]